jgi:hypothetical protein
MELMERWNRNNEAKKQKNKQGCNGLWKYTRYKFAKKFSAR